MIDSIIIAGALQNASRLTLPGLGTILKKSDGSFVFSQFMRDDDMYFTSVVMNTYAVGTDEAKEMVSRFMADVNSRLASRGDYPIPGIGWLVREQSGSTRLVSDSGVQAEPVYQDAQPRQPVMPRPIVGVPQQAPQRNMVPPAQNPYYGQQRQQVPYGPGPQPVIPQRRPQQQAPQQRPPQQRPQMRPPQPQPQPQRAPQHHPKQRTRPDKPVKKDWLLIATIFVAMLVLLLMVYSFFTASLSDFI